MKKQKEEGKDKYKELILKSVMITMRCVTIIDALEYLNDNPELYDIAYKALELFEKEYKK